MRSKDGESWGDMERWWVLDWLRWKDGGSWGGRAKMLGPWVT